MLPRRTCGKYKKTVLKLISNPLSGEERERGFDKVVLIPPSQSGIRMSPAESQERGRGM